MQTICQIWSRLLRFRFVSWRPDAWNPLECAAFRWNADLWPSKAGVAWLDPVARPWELGRIMAIIFVRLKIERPKIPWLLNTVLLQVAMFVAPFLDKPKLLQSPNISKAWNDSMALKVGACEGPSATTLMSVRWPLATRRLAGSSWETSHENHPTTAKNIPNIQ